jgi:spore germination protein KC
MLKKYWIIISFIVILVNLSACYDAQEPADISFVSFIGIDRGVSDKYRVTVKLYNMQQQSKDSVTTGGNTGGNSKETENDTIIIDAPSFYAGVNLLNTSIPHKLNFTHTGVIVVSKELAESGLIGEFIAPLIRYRELRRTTDIIVVDGSSQSFIEKMGDYLGEDAASMFESLLYEADNTGFFPHITLNDFYNALKSTYYQPIATYGAINDFSNFTQQGQKWGDEFKIPGKLYAAQIPRKGGNSIELLGSAIFNKDRMVGQLDGHETRMLLLLNGNYQKGIFTIQDPIKPNLIIPINLRLVDRPKIEIYLNGDKANISITIRTEGDIYAIQSNINYENPQLIKMIENATQQQLIQGLYDVIAKCQSMNSDVFGFGKYVLNKFATIEELESYNWNDRFNQADIKISVEFKIRKTGGIINSYPLED